MIHLALTIAAFLFLLFIGMAIVSALFRSLFGGYRPSKTDKRAVQNDIHQYQLRRNKKSVM